MFCLEDDEVAREGFVPSLGGSVREASIHPPGCREKHGGLTASKHTGWIVHCMAHVGMVFALCHQRVGSLEA